LSRVTVKRSPSARARSISIDTILFSDMPDVVLVCASHAACSLLSLTVLVVAIRDSIVVARYWHKV